MLLLPKPTDDISFFEEIKILSNKYWADFDLNSKIHGYQIQKGSQWKQGLSDEELLQFEKSMGFKFPAALRNFYSVMNGLDKPGINIYGNSEADKTYKSVFHSFNDDLEVIKERINFIFESFDLQQEDLEIKHISRIFPVYQHRFMLIDEPGCPILSIYGNDVIYWSDNISKLLATEIFSDIYNPWDFESNPKNSRSIKFWLD